MTGAEEWRIGRIELRVTALSARARDEGQVEIPMRHSRQEAIHFHGSTRNWSNPGEETIRKDDELH